MEWLERLCDAIWQPWLLGFLLISGLYFSLGTGFFQIFGLRVWLGATLGAAGRGSGQGGAGGISQVQAISTALASTIGTGSIAGVAVAVFYGGPGALFWLWVSALLGMMTSFVEKTLAVSYRRPDGRGGPMYYLRDGLHSPLLALLFALACLCSALVGGNLVQASAIAGTLEDSLGLSRILCGLLLCLLTALVLRGGLERVAKLSALLAPFMALLYVGAGVLILCLRIRRLPAVLSSVFQQALGPRALLGGGAGAAMRYGVARGVFTNEAGLGTSAVAHAAARVDHPARQGMWGILEVAVSSLLVCSVTALVLLSGDALTTLPVPGAEMTAASFAETLGDLGSGLVSLSLLLFALSSIFGWSYYGEQGLVYLTQRALPRRLYRVCFLLCAFLGCLWEGPSVWLLVDLSSALLALPNLLALLLLSPKAFSLLREFQAKMLSKS